MAETWNLWLLPRPGLILSLSYQHPALALNMVSHLKSSPYWGIPPRMWTSLLTYKSSREFKCVTTTFLTSWKWSLNVANPRTSPRKQAQCIFGTGLIGSTEDKSCSGARFDRLYSNKRRHNLQPVWNTFLQSLRVPWHLVALHSITWSHRGCMISVKSIRRQLTKKNFGKNLRLQRSIQGTIRWRRSPNMSIWQMTINLQL